VRGGGIEQAVGRNAPGIAVDQDKRSSNGGYDGQPLKGKTTEGYVAFVSLSRVSVGGTDGLRRWRLNR